MTGDIGTTGSAKKIGATRARQGLRGKHVLWVLAISTVLALIVLLGIALTSSPALDGSGGQARSDNPTQFEAPVTPARQN